MKRAVGSKSRDSLILRGSRLEAYRKLACVSARVHPDGPICFDVVPMCSLILRIPWHPVNQVRVPACHVLRERMVDHLVTRRGGNTEGRNERTRSKVNSMLFLQNRASGTSVRETQLFQRSFRSVLGPVQPVRDPHVWPLHPSLSVCHQQRPRGSARLLVICFISVRWC